MSVKKWESADLGISIEIDYEKCEGHAECIDVCPTDVYELENGKAVVPNIGECIECCSCVEVCPTDAIKHSSC